VFLSNSSASRLVRWERALQPTMVCEHVIAASLRCSVFRRDRDRITLNQSAPGNETGESRGSVVMRPLEGKVPVAPAANVRSLGKTNVATGGCGAQ